MEDLIRRSDAIAILKDLQSKHLQFCLIPFRQAIERVQALPSTDKWIPCEERMPMYNVDVLVYRPTMGQKIIVDTYCGYYGDDIDDIDEWYEGWGISREHAVTAWMPLPKPYKGADDE